MADQSLTIKDGNGALKSLSVFSGSLGLIPEHAISGTVNVSASSANPVYVTGNVSISQPVNVDIVVGDSIAVTSSLAAPLYVSSSANSPILATGSFTVNNFPNTQSVTSSLANPVVVTGSVEIVNTPTSSVTASFLNPVAVTGTILSSVTSSFANPVVVTGTVQVANTLTSSVTASFLNPVAVTGTILASISSSNPSGSTKNKYTIGSPIVYDVNTSGTFQLAAASSTRKGLIIHNSSSSELFITLGSGTLNGFSNISQLTGSPDSFSFILYPSGTYIAETSIVNLFHGGWFVSSSNVGTAAALVTTTE